MLELLTEKLNLIKKIEEITTEILNVSLDNETSSIILNDLITKRQDIMNKIDIIDDKIKRKDLSCPNIDEKYKRTLDKNIKILLKNIINMDNKIKHNIEHELISIKNNINNVEQKIQTSNFELDDEDKKPVGYFLNKKS